MRFVISEKIGTTTRSRIAGTAGALAAAVFIISCMLQIEGYPVGAVWLKLIQGGFGSLYALHSTFIRTVPLAIASIGILFAFKMKFWNIGGEGQILMGAFAATGFALFCPSLPRPVLLLLMFTAGFAGGGLWATVASVLKVRRGMNETIVTLMLNYIALQWVTFLQYNLWRDKSGLNFPKIPLFSDNAILPDFLGIHLGFWIMLLIVIGTALFFRYTKEGFKMQIIGESLETARYLRINSRRMMLIMIFVSGGLCGITGMIQASAVNNTLNIGITDGVGFTAIIVAWLSGLNPYASLAVSFVFAGLTEGASSIQTAFRIPETVATLMEGIILFCVIAVDFYNKYSVRLVRRERSNCSREQIHG
jgi:general nucleoside transport system permease protein